MNHNRILCRLQSRHCRSKKQQNKKNKGERGIIPSLGDIIRDVPEAAASTLRPYVENLQSTFHRLEMMDGRSAKSQNGLVLLISLICEAHAMASQTEFEALRCTLLQSGSKADQKIILSTVKLGRYLSACQNLAEVAYRYRCFAHVRLEIVRLAPIPAVMVSENPMFPSPREQHPKPATRKSLMRLIRNNASILHGDNAVKHILAPLIMAKCAVHAEVQLLVHYEFSIRPSVPRVICSTKKACFLCDLLFKLHGRFHIPSTHGKLYEKWTLPASLFRQNITGLCDILRSFAYTIDSLILKTMGEHETPYTTVNESGEFASMIWSQSVSSSEGQPSSKASPNAQTGSESPSPGSNLQNQRPDLTSLSNYASSKPAIIMEDQSQTLDLEDFPLSERSGQISSVAVGGLHSKSRSFQLHPTERLDVDIHPGQHLHFETARIHLTLEFEDRKAKVSRYCNQSSNMSQSVSFPTRIHIRCIGAIEEIKQIAQEQSAIDLNTMSEGLEISQTWLANGMSAGLLLFEGWNAIYLHSKSP